MMSCYMPGCERPVVKTREGSPLCLRHYNQAYIGGWTLEAMADRFTATCAIAGCDREADTLDHRHACCENGPFRVQRCGGCNRGFLCRRCNLDVGLVERRTSFHEMRVAAGRRAAIADYLTAYSA